MSTSTRAQASLDAQRDGELSHRQIMTIIFGLMTGMFLAALDQNIVGTAIRTISDDLKGLDVQAWVTTAYLITSTISTPIYGKLSDIYGRKPFFLAAIAIFVIGSFLCTFSTSMYMLAAFRAVQGLGAGGLMSLALAIIGDIVPPRERAKYQGYFLAVFGTSSVAGPVIGGFFAGADSLFGITGWRWVFLINVPLGAIAFFAVTMTLHLHHTRRDAKIDWDGAAALIFGLVPLLTLAEQGREWGWTSGKSIAAGVIGVIGLLFFVLAEYRMGDNALIPLRIFKNRTIVIGLVSGFVVGAGMFGAMMTLPQFYLQIINGASPTMAGLQMLPMVLGLMFASIVSGQMMTRTGLVKPFPVFGVGVMTVMLLVMHTISADTELWKVMLMMFAFGIGLGSVMQPLTLIVQSAVAPREIGMATSAATFFRQIGGTLGVAIFLSVMFNELTGNMKDALISAQSDPNFLAATKDPAVMKNPANVEFLQSLKGGGGEFFHKISSDSSVLEKLDPRLAHPIKQGFASSLDTIFLLGMITCAIGFLVLLLLPNIVLSNKSAQQLAAEADAAKAVTSEADSYSLLPLGPDASDEDKALHASLTKFLVDAAADMSAGHTMDELPDTWDPEQGRHAESERAHREASGGTRP